MSATTLPTPTGPHPVGRHHVDLVDERRDPYARRDVPRVLPVTVWYPSADTTAAAPAGDRPGHYLPGWWRPVSWMWGLRAGDVVTHAVDGAAPAADAGSLVVLSPSANPAHCHTALAEDLASHGYVVAGISHTYESMPVTAFAERAPRLVRLRSLGGALATPGARPYEVDLAERAAVVTVKADDIAAVAAALFDGAAGTVPVRPGPWAAIGHSFGGGAVAELAVRGGSCAAGVSFDGGLWRRPDAAEATIPFLQLFAEHPELTDPIEHVVARKQYASTAYATEDRATTIASWQAMHSSSPAGHSAVVVGAAHTSFGDWPLLDLRAWSPARRALAGRLGPAVHTSVAAAVRTFLGRHLGGVTTDVETALRADAALRVGEPAALFAPATALAH